SISKIHTPKRVVNGVGNNQVIADLARTMRRKKSQTARFAELSNGSVAVLKPALPRADTTHHGLAVALQLHQGVSRRVRDQQVTVRQRNSLTGESQARCGRLRWHKRTI